MWLALRQGNELNLLVIPDNPDGIPNVFPRQSSLDEGNDGSAFDLNPESQTLRMPQQTGQERNDDDSEASNFTKAESPKETAPAGHQVYKTPVQAEPDDKSDMYFIGKFVVSYWC
jgi:hypothetical protein